MMKTEEREMFIGGLSEEDERLFRSFEEGEERLKSMLESMVIRKYMEFVNRRENGTDYHEIYEDKEFLNFIEELVDSIDNKHLTFYLGNIVGCIFRKEAEIKNRQGADGGQSMMMGTEEI